ncbi:MAG: phosphoribosyl-AMP cyclohydrolase [Rhodospirillales bacterium]|nr:phosphoribosyl-AMP cyclohydrolase [Rhodospirillales bacterium]
MEFFVNELSDQQFDALAGGLTFDQNGLIPAIAQQYDTGEVLMMAWMNRDALAATLQEGRAVFWSRSRDALWRKGETSGQTQELKELRWDCDNDTILLMVNQTGVACHTGRRSCFFNALRGGQIETISEIEISPDKLYGK